MSLLWSTVFMEKKDTTVMETYKITYLLISIWPENILQYFGMNSIIFLVIFNNHNVSLNIITVNIHNWVV